MSEIAEEKGTASDSEEFVDEVNVYLKTTTSDGPLPDVSPENSSKAVKFAIDEAEREDSRRDHSRSPQELLAKIARLTDLLRVAEEQISTEKDKRRKKEKSLLKLAKELKKRNQIRDKEMERMEELEEKIKYLEHHWILAQKELDQEKALRGKLQNESNQEFERLLADEKDKHAKVCKEYEDSISEMKKRHQLQCDELCQEVLKTNLEADRLHSQLNNGSPRNARLFSEKTSGRGVPPSAIIFSILLAVLALVGSNIGLYTKDALCSPVMPGRVLRTVDSGSVFEAPWWAPESMKAEAFKRMCCEELPPTKFEWLPYGNVNKAVLTYGGKVLFVKKDLAKVDFFGDRLRLWNRKGTAEEHMSLWSV